MEHTFAINQFVLPICMAIIVYFFSCIWRMLHRILNRNDEDHDRFSDSLNRHSIRITRLETRVSSLSTHNQTEKSSA